MIDRGLEACNVLYGVVTRPLGGALTKRNVGAK
jgi:hypothetical protein